MIDYKGDYEVSVVLEFVRLDFETDNPEGCDGLFFNDYDNVYIEVTDMYIYVRLYYDGCLCTRFVPISNFRTFLRDKNINICLV